MNRINKLIKIYLWILSYYAYDSIALALPNTKGVFVVSQIQDSAYNLKEAAREIAKKSDTLGTLPQIDALKKKIKQLKDNAGLIAIETSLKPAQVALNEAIANLYTKSVNGQNVNLYNEIYNVLQELFNDPIIKQKSNQILELQQEMIQRVLANPNPINHWTKQIQNAGQRISTLAQEQEKAIDPLLIQLQATKMQLLKARQESKELAPLEQKLYLKNSELQNAQNELSTSVKEQIKKLQDNIQKSTFLLQFIQDPRKAASASPESIVTQENDPAFATKQ